jgi:hypothetical protein
LPGLNDGPGKRSTARTHHSLQIQGPPGVATTVPGKVANTFLLLFLFTPISFSEGSGSIRLSITDLIGYTGMTSCGLSLQKYGFTLENQVELLLE